VCWRSSRKKPSRCLALLVLFAIQALLKFANILARTSENILADLRI
jgi:hypothetical protein